MMIFASLLTINFMCCFSKPDSLYISSYLNDVQICPNELRNTFIISQHNSLKINHVLVLNSGGSTSGYLNSSYQPMIMKFH